MKFRGTDLLVVLVSDEVPLKPKRKYMMYFAQDRHYWIRRRAEAEKEIRLSIANQPDKDPEYILLLSVNNVIYNAFL